MSDRPNKRKIIDLVEGSTAEDMAKNIKILATALNAMSDSMNAMSDSINRIQQSLEGNKEQPIAFSNDTLSIVANSSKEDTKAASESEDDLSDDDETVVDESDTWMIKYRQLREFLIMNGHCNVPTKSFKENPPLGQFVNNLRRQYTNVKMGKKGRRISPERIILLDRLGFNWGKKFQDPPSWDDMYDKLCDFQQKMGSCNVPFNASNPNELAKWAAYQRAEYKRFKKGKDSLLTLDQIGKLNDIKFNWKGPKL